MAATAGRFDDTLASVPAPKPGERTTPQAAGQVRRAGTVALFALDASVWRWGTRQRRVDRVLCVPWPMVARHPGIVDLRVAQATSERTDADPRRGLQARAGELLSDHGMAAFGCLLVGQSLYQVVIDRNEHALEVSGNAVGGVMAMAAGRRGL